MHRAPSLLIQEVQADDAVAIDVGVHGHLEVLHGPINESRIGEPARHEDDFGRLDRVVAAELEGEAERLVRVQGVGGVEDADVHEPFGEVLGGDEGDAGWGLRL